MEKIFKSAHDRRRMREFYFTSGGTNAISYGSPAWARKKDIWPPLSKVTDFEDSQSFLDSQAVAQSSDVGPRRTYSEIEDHVISNAATSQQEDLDKSEWDYTSPSEFQNELYRPLHHGKITRILDIRPGEQEDPVFYDFHYVDLGQSHEGYEALSYVWNDNSVGRSGRAKPKVTCNGHEETTPNLWDALTHIRSSTETKHLWVDALCIGKFYYLQVKTGNI